MYVYSRLPSDRLLAGSTPGPSGGCFYLCWDVNWSRTYQITLSLFTVCFPLANVISRSTNPPIANFLPTPIAKKKPSILLSPLWMLTNKRTVGHQWTSSDILQTSTTQPFLSHHLEQCHQLRLWSLRTWTLTYVTTPTYCPLLLQHQFSVNYWNIVYYCNTVSKDIQFSTCKIIPGSSMKTGLPMFVPGLFR